MAGWPSALVGRRDEVTALERALVEVGRRASRVVALRGEPGIGKSRLLVELAGRARERGLLVVDGRATELERDLTFALLLDALESLVSDGTLAGTIGELEDWQLRELAAVLPAVGPLAGAERAPVSGERHRVARAVRSLLERVAAERPLALLLDDVHWADPASADVLALLLHRPPRAGVLLALATRAGRAPALESALTAAQQHGAAEVLDLGPLPLEAVARCCPGHAARRCERLYRESGGNPFYLQELLRAGGLEASGGRAAALAGVPAAVQAALAGEVAALSPAGRRVLEGAAVVGDPFEPELAGAGGRGRRAGRAGGAGRAAGGGSGAADRPAATVSLPPSARAAGGVRGRGRRLAAGGARTCGRGAGERAARRRAQRAHHVERAARPGDLAAVDLLVAAAEEVTRAAPATAAGWYDGGAAAAARDRRARVAPPGAAASAGAGARVRRAAGRGARRAAPGPRRAAARRGRRARRGDRDAGRAAGRLDAAAGRGTPAARGRAGRAR